MCIIPRSKLRLPPEIEFKRLSAAAYESILEVNGGSRGDVGSHRGDVVGGGRPVDCEGIHDNTHLPNLHNYYYYQRRDVHGWGAVEDPNGGASFFVCVCSIW